MYHAVMVNVRGRDIELEISPPKQGVFPLVTPRADGMCCVETWPFPRWVPIGDSPFGLETTVFQTRIFWYYYEPSLNAVHRYDPDQPPIVLDPAVLDTSDPDEARRQHAYLVDCIDLGLMHGFLDEEGRQAPIAHGFSWALPGRPIRSPGGGMLCPKCRARIEAQWEAAYCIYCGTCLSLSPEL